MVSTRSSPLTHSIPALPPKRRLSLTPLSPNIPPEAVHNNNNNNNKKETEEMHIFTSKEPHRRVMQSTPSKFSARPPRNPSEQSAVGKRNSTQKDDDSTPITEYNKNNSSSSSTTKKTKIHYFENDDVLTIPDPPTPDQTTSIREAATKLLESRAKRRRSLLVLGQSDVDLPTPHHCNPSLSLHGDSSTGNAHTQLEKDDSEEPKERQSICFDEAYENDQNAPLENISTDPSPTDTVVKGRRSILLPSEAKNERIFGLDSIDGWMAESADILVPNRPQESRSTGSPRTHKRSESNRLDTDKMECVKRSVRIMCNLPWEKRYLSSEASFIEELSGYPILNPMDKIHRTTQLTSKNATPSDPPTKTSVDNVAGPTDQMKIQLINHLAPHLEYLEAKKSKEIDILEKATGYRVVKGKNGRLTYTGIHNSESITAKEYEKIYRSASCRNSKAFDLPSKPFAPQTDSTDDSSNQTSETMIIVEMRRILETFRSMASSDTIVEAARQRLIDEIDASMNKYELVLRNYRNTE